MGMAGEDGSAAAQPDFPPGMAPKILMFMKTLEQLEQKLKPLLSQPYHEVLARLSPQERAKVMMMELYAINSLFWVLTKTSDEDVDQSFRDDCKLEMDRLKEAQARLSELEARPSRHRLDREAAARFIRRGLGRQTRRLAEEENVEPERPDEEETMETERQDEEENVAGGSYKSNEIDSLVTDFLSQARMWTDDGAPSERSDGSSDENETGEMNPNISDFLAVMRKGLGTQTNKCHDGDGDEAGHQDGSSADDMDESDDSEDEAEGYSKEGQRNWYSDGWK